MFRRYFIFSAILCFIVLFLQCSHQRPTDAKGLLYNYGFSNAKNPSAEELTDAIKKFQNTTGLAVTGSLTEETVTKLSGRRCGMPSSAPKFLAARYKWRKGSLTYAIRNATESLKKSQVRDILERSIKQWTDRVNLQIRESTTDKADIDVFFTEQDGLSNTLGYAYFPENGDIYMDIDENWTADESKSSIKTNFGWVATHELGHSLGLPHSEFMDSIMFAYYSDEVTKPTDRDIRSLAALYGDKPDNNVLCSNTGVDGFLDISNKMIIKGKQYWTFSERSLQGGPFSLEDVFPGLPDKVDSAFAIHGTSYFFKDDVFYRYKANKKTYTKKLIARGFDDAPTHIDGSFFDRGQTIYFFKGSKYYTFDIRKPVGKRLIINGKSISNDWNGIPDDIDAATILNDSQVLFIKGNRCYIVNLSSRELVSSDDCSSSFYNCKK